MAGALSRPPHTRKEMPMEALELWQHLFGNHTGYLCIAHRRPDQPGMAHEYFAWPDDAERAAARVGELGEAHDVWFCVRLLAEPRRLASTPGPVTALWCDVDQAVELHDWPDDVPWPTAVVESGRGWHCYWRLTEPVDPREAAALCRALAERLGGDPVAAEPARLLRVPGTRNFKYEPARPVRVRELLADAAYPPSTFRALVTGSSNGHAHEPVRALVQRTLREGERNASLTRVAGLLRGEFGFDEPELYATLSALNQLRCDPPLPDSEVRTIARSALRWSPNPRIVANGHEPDGQATVPESWVPVPAGELVHSEEPDVPWVWRYIVARGHLTLLSGHPKVGKSTLVTLLLERMARGGALAGEPVEAGKVLVVSEESRALWAKRARAHQLDHVDVLCRPFVGRATEPDWLRFCQHVAALVRERGYAVVVFDTLAALWPCADENDASAALRALTPLLAIAEAGAAVLCVHHLRKSDGAEGTAARGSSAIVGFFDFIAELRRFEGEHDQRRRLSVLSRYEGLDLVIDRDGDSLGDPATVGRRALEEGVLAVLAEAGDAGMTADEVAEAAGLPRATAARVLRRLADAGQVGCFGRGARGNPLRWFAVATKHEFDSPTENPMSGMWANRIRIQSGSPTTGTLVQEGQVTEHRFDSPTPNPIEETWANRIPVQSRDSLAQGDQVTEREFDSPTGNSMRGIWANRIPVRPDTHAPGSLVQEGHTAKHEFDSPTQNPMREMWANRIPVQSSAPTAGSLVQEGHATESEFDSPTETPMRETWANRIPIRPGTPASTPVGEGEATGRPQPDDDVVAWAERVLAQLERGDLVLPAVAYRPGATVVDPVRFLRSHLAEARLGIAQARENLERYRRAVQRVGGVT